MISMLVLRVRLLNNNNPSLSILIEFLLLIHIERNSLRLDQTERVSVASREFTEPSDRQRTLSITSLGSQQAALLTKESLPVMVSHTVQCHSPETEVNDLLGVTAEGEELLLVTGGDDSSVTIRDLSMEVNSSVTLSGSGSVTSRTLLCGGSVLCLDYTALSLDRVSLLLGASADHSVRVWNIASGKLKCSLTTFTAAVTCARFLGEFSLFSTRICRC
jgi:WD40 repeat protein